MIKWQNIVVMDTLCYLFSTSFISPKSSKEQYLVFYHVESSVNVCAVFIDKLKLVTCEV